MSRGFRKADLRRIYIQEHPLAFTLACATTLTGVAYMLDQNAIRETVFGQALPTWLLFPWSLMVAIGAGAIAVGIYNINLRLESAGLALLGTVYLVNTILVMSQRGLSSGLTSATFGALAIGCWARCYVLLKYGSAYVDGTRLEGDRRRKTRRWWS